MGFAIVENPLRTLWAPLNYASGGAATAYLGGLVYSGGGSGVIPLATASGAADTSQKYVPFGVVIGWNDRTPSGTSVASVQSQAAQNARDFAGVEGMWSKNDQRVFVQVALIGPETVLREAGFDEQPFWAPRWDVTGGDVYGYSPGMEALPALRELQLQVKRRNEAIDLMVHPEKIVPVGIRLTGQPRSVVTASNVDKDSVLIPYQMPYQAVAALSEEARNARSRLTRCPMLTCSTPLPTCRAYSHAISKR